MQKWREHTSKDGYLTEQGRLEGQHEVLIFHMGKAVYAPVDLDKAGLRILDTGCANGRWLDDIREPSKSENPHFYGVDIRDEVFPAAPPSSMHFRKQDIKDEFPSEWQDSFDLVHQRLSMSGAAPGTPTPVIGNFLKLLKPGGWLQLVEPDVQDCLDNGPMMIQFIRMLRALSVKSGIGPGAIEFKSLMEELGFDAVAEIPVTVQYGASLTQRELAEKSVVALCAAVGPLTNVLKHMAPEDFSKEDLDDFDLKLRHELETTGGSIKFLVVYGQRPAMR